MCTCNNYYDYLKKNYLKKNLKKIIFFSSFYY